MTSKTDGFSVAGGMWTTTLQTLHPTDKLYRTSRYMSVNCLTKSI